MAFPPGGASEREPVGTNVFDGTAEVLRSVIWVDAVAGDHDRHESSGPHELGQIGQVSNLGTEVVVAVDADHAVEVAVREAQIVRFTSDRDHTVRDAGLDDAGQVQGWLDPQIRLPHLRTNLAS